MWKLNHSSGVLWVEELCNVFHSKKIHAIKTLQGSRLKKKKRKLVKEIVKSVNVC